MGRRGCPDGSLVGSVALTVILVGKPVTWEPNIEEKLWKIRKKLELNTKVRKRIKRKR